MTTPDPARALPLDEPTTVADVKAGLRITDTDDDADLAGIVAAVCRVVRRLPIADELRADQQLAPTAWPADVKLGARMLAGRLLRRKNSPDGVVTVGDLGPVYIQRNDPDLALLLGLGDYARPAVG